MKNLDKTLHRIQVTLKRPPYQHDADTEAESLAFIASGANYGHNRVTRWKHDKKAGTVHLFVPEEHSQKVRSHLSKLGYTHKTIDNVSENTQIKTFKQFINNLIESHVLVSEGIKYWDETGGRGSFEHKKLTDVLNHQFRNTNVTAKYAKNGQKHDYKIHVNGKHIGTASIRHDEDEGELVPGVNRILKQHGHSARATLDEPAPQECPDCKGSGVNKTHKSPEDKWCKKCDGEGVLAEDLKKINEMKTYKEIAALNRYELDKKGPSPSQFREVLTKSDKKIRSQGPYAKVSKELFKRANKLKKSMPDHAHLYQVHAKLLGSIDSKDHEKSARKLFDTDLHSVGNVILALHQKHTSPEHAKEYYKMAGVKED